MGQNPEGPLPGLVPSDPPLLPDRGLQSDNNPVEIGLMLLFGVLGYLMKKFKYDGAPLVLAMVLGPLMDNSLRQSLLMSGGSGTIFFTRPICLVILGVVALILLLPVLPLISRIRKTVEKTEEN